MPGKLPSQILRLSRTDRTGRTDDESGYVLVKVVPTGSRPLDVKLVGTDGDDVFATVLRHSQAQSLIAENGQCSPEEWRTIFESVLRQDAADDIQTTATVEDGAAITVTVRRKNPQGITQRLGEVSLKHDGGEEIQLFDWAGGLVLARLQGKQDVVAAKARVRELESAVEELRSQLNDLIATKQKEEAGLYEKFRDLLNEKKAKIREQQKVIAEAIHSSPKQDQPGQAEPVQSEEEPAPKPKPSKTAKTPKTSMRRKPGPSRPAKRKSPTVAVKEEEEEEEDEKEVGGDDARSPPVEPMDVDEEETQGESETPSEDRNTTGDDATATEADDSEDEEPVKKTKRPAPKPAAQKRVRQPPARGAKKTAAGPAEKSSPARGQKKAEPPKPASSKAPDKAPPKRTLPFAAVQKAKAVTAPAPAPAPSGGSETDSDDDEL